VRSEAVDSLADHIGERKLLLMLASLEQVTAAAPGWQILLDRCPACRRGFSQTGPRHTGVMQHHRLGSGTLGGDGSLDSGATAALPRLPPGETALRVNS
jgi:hypothetical protein